MKSSIHKNNTLLVAGAVHIDEVAFAKAPLVMRASNPISWSRSAGGVACNSAMAAHACKNTDTAVQLVGAIGNDASGLQLEKALAATGMDARLQLVDDAQTGRYTAVIDSDGELSLGLADVSIAEQLHAGQILAGMAGAKPKAVLLDANLSQSCLEQIVRTTFTDSVPIAAMAVSPFKALRLLNIASHVQLLFCNRREAIAVCQSHTTRVRSHDSSIGIEELADGLQETGFSQFVLTDGSRPIVIQSQHERQLISVPALDKVRRNVNGAGDALAGATFAAWAQDVPLPLAVTDFGLPMAADVVMGRRASLTLAQRLH